MEIKVIGVGGITSCLIPVLLKFLDYSDYKDVSVTLIDGDNYEDDNASRQTFNRLGNKAEVTAERFKGELRKVDLQFKPIYVKKSNIRICIREGDIIFSCVDEHIVRRQIAEYCNTLDNIVVISGGNDYMDGNIQIHIRKDGKNITLPINNEFHSEIRDAEGKNPGDISCGELVEKGEPQLIITNNDISARMLNAFYAYLQGKISYDEVYSDILSNKSRPVDRTNA